MKYFYKSIRKDKKDVEIKIGNKKICIPFQGIELEYKNLHEMYPNNIGLVINNESKLKDLNFDDKINEEDSSELKNKKSRKN